AATYLFQSLIARWLTTQAYGEFAAILAILNVVAIPMFGICMAITRDVAAAHGVMRHQLGRLLRPYLFRIGTITVLILIVLMLSTPWLGSFFSWHRSRRSCSSHCYLCSPKRLALAGRCSLACTSLLVLPRTRSWRGLPELRQQW